MIRYKAIELTYEEKESFISRAVDKDGNRMPNYDMPHWDKMEIALMDKLNQWYVDNSFPKIISIQKKNGPRGEQVGIFYMEDRDEKEKL